MVRTLSNKELRADYFLQQGELGLVELLLVAVGEGGDDLVDHGRQLHLGEQQQKPLEPQHDVLREGNRQREHRTPAFAQRKDRRRRGTLSASVCAPMRLGELRFMRAVKRSKKSIMSFLNVSSLMAGLPVCLMWRIRDTMMNFIVYSKACGSNPNNISPLPTRTHVSRTRTTAHENTRRF